MHVLRTTDSEVNSDVCRDIGELNGVAALPGQLIDGIKFRCGGVFKVIDIVARATIEPVASRSSPQHIVAGSATQKIVKTIAEQSVIPPAAGQIFNDITGTKSQDTIRLHHLIGCDAQIRMHVGGDRCECQQVNTAACRFKHCIGFRSRGCFKDIGIVPGNTAELITATTADEHIRQTVACQNVVCGAAIYGFERSSRIEMQCSVFMD